MKIKAQGILRHMFHGSYACAIGLEFANEKDCEAAIDLLNDLRLQDQGDESCDLGSWKAGEKNAAIAVGSLNGKQLDAFKSKFHPKCKPCNSFDCKGKNKIHEIDGVNHSLDVGSPFVIEFEIENPNQGSLF